MPTTKKRWLVVLPETQQEWVRDTAEEVGMKGSDIISELIGNGMKDSKFKASLSKARAIKELQSLTEKKEALEEEIKQIKRKTED